MRDAESNQNIETIYNKITIIYTTDTRVKTSTTSQHENFDVFSQDKHIQCISLSGLLTKQLINLPVKDYAREFGSV